jgi:hypothetical protein
MTLKGVVHGAVQVLTGALPSKYLCISVLVCVCDKATYYDQWPMDKLITHLGLNTFYKAVNLEYAFLVHRPSTFKEKIIAEG